MWIFGRFKGDFNEKVVMKSFRNLSVHTKIFLGWSICVSAGLYGFVLSKRYITSRRYESMKARERMRNALNDQSPDIKPEKHLTW